MPRTAKNQPVDLSHDKAVAGLLALQIEERETQRDEKHEPRKTKVVLAGAGLTAPEIATLMGKNKDAVAKAITRGRATKRKKRGGKK